STGAPPDDKFLTQKKPALRRLETTVEALRSFRDQHPNEKDRHRALIQKTQQLVLKALLLDRENEQLLLKASLGPNPAATSQSFPSVEPLPQTSRGVAP